jgi:hypothetical protein
MWEYFMYTKESFIQKAINTHGTKYDYTNVVFVNTDTDVSIICATHGIFLQKPGSHMRGTGCQQCALTLRKEQISKRNSAGKSDQATFIANAIAVHGDRYDYTKTTYKGLKYKVTITCKEHGDFIQLATAHIGNKQGCPSCFKFKRNFIPDFEQKARAIHGDHYSYGKIDFMHKQNGKVTITCSIHDFWCSPANHISKKAEGCSECGKARRKMNNIARNKEKTLTTSEFITKAKLIHGDLYDYAKTQYVASISNVVITCTQHGDFELKASYHLDGSGCKKCAAIGKSKMCEGWLDELMIPEINREVRLYLDGTLIVADAYDPATNTIYEFWGDYWHGNLTKYDAETINTKCGKTFGELYDLTQEKVALIKRTGYNLVDIWESDWLKLLEESK